MTPDAVEASASLPGQANILELFKERMQTGWGGGGGEASQMVEAWRAGWGGGAGWGAN